MPEVLSVNVILAYFGVHTPINSRLLWSRSYKNQLVARLTNLLSGYSCSVMMVVSWLIETPQCPRLHHFVRHILIESVFHLGSHLCAHSHHDDEKIMHYWWGIGNWKQYRVWLTTSAHCERQRIQLSGTSCNLSQVKHHHQRKQITMWAHVSMSTPQYQNTSSRFGQYWLWTQEDWAYFTLHHTTGH